MKTGFRLTYIGILPKVNSNRLQPKQPEIATMKMTAMKSRRFYPLTDDSEKSEFIKDILAFTNSWRRTDAIILIGVDEVKGGGRSNPLGITKHLRDSDLQQLVNSKTNRPITFSYKAVKFQTVDLGVIKIPVQERPVFLTRNFGKLKKE